MTKSDPVPIIISVASLVIAFAAFITSWRAQRASYRLQLRAEGQIGRIQAVEGIYGNQPRRLGIGFRIRNGRTAVTVTNATIIMTCTAERPSSILWDKKFNLYVQSDEFSFLGITGPTFSFRLESFDEAEWRFPFLASFNLPQSMPDNDDGKDRQQIGFTFSVTASGETKSSTLFLVDGTISSTIFGYKSLTNQYTGAKALEGIILSAAAQEAVRKIASNPPPTEHDKRWAQTAEKLGMRVPPPENVPPPELKQLAQAMPDIPAALRKWLMCTWEEGGSFNDESTEKLARTLVKLRSPDLNPDIRVTLAQAASRH